MAPVLVASNGIDRVVLIVEMIYVSRISEQAIWIIHEALWGREMDLRSIQTRIVAANDVGRYIHRHLSRIITNDEQ